MKRMVSKTVNCGGGGQKACEVRAYRSPGAAQRGRVELERSCGIALASAVDLPDVDASVPGRRGKNVVVRREGDFTDRVDVVRKGDGYVLGRVALGGVRGRARGACAEEASHV